MDALIDRVENLIFEYKYIFNPNKFKKTAFHLDYDEKKYRQDELIKIIRDSITHFALTPDEFASMSSKGDIGEMQRIAWSRISKAKAFKKGDYGELLLYLILTVFYKVPKFVTKVRLRSSVKEQIKGFDCAHFTVEDDEAILWLGEAKFHQKFSGALADAMTSIDDHFNQEYLKDEISILYSNVEANAGNDLDILKKALRGKSIDKIKFRVPILLTYDSNSIKDCDNINDVFKSEIEKELFSHNVLIEKKIFSTTKDIELIFIMFPLHTVADIKRQLEVIEDFSR